MSGSTTLGPYNRTVVMYTEEVYRRAMSSSTRRHPRLRALLIGAGLLLSFVLVAAVLSLALYPINPGVPLDPGIPNEQALIDAGLSGSPAPGQPTAPIAVDRVLVDGAATYVQYHISGPGGPQGDPLPTLSDDRGVPVTGGSSSNRDDAPDWPLPFPLPAWLPWRPSTIRRGYLILPPLPLTAHAAILQFGVPHSTLGPGSGETVRVPLGPRASILQRVAHPATTARAAGLTLALGDLGPAHLTYTYAPRGGPPSSDTQVHIAYSSRATPGGAAFDPAGQLVDAAGHLVPTTALGADCATDAQSLRCATTVVFPPQPPATRLTLTIRAVQVGAWFAPLPRVTRGPWRLPFTVP